MSDKWEISVWGVRGSFPRAVKEKQIFGGNTSCISVACGNTAVILDAGSGITDYADSFQKERFGHRLNILISHLHMDHVIGLFSFPPLLDPDMEIHFYGHAGLQSHLEALVCEPYWPIGFDGFSAKIFFHEFEAGSSFEIENIHIDTMPSVHPNGCVLYRLTDGNKTLAYTLDCELTEEIKPGLTEFCRDCDLLVWDANFTSDDIVPDWGHSTWEQGIAMRQSAGAKKVIMTHYKRNNTDEYLLQLEAAAVRQDAACIAAKEGMVLTL